MNKSKALFMFLLLVVFSCSKNPCDKLENDVYIYPEAKGKSFEEAIEIYKIPEHVLQCISTEGLIKSCLTYPEMRLIWTRNSLQAGFDYIERLCNGFNELWMREDKSHALIDLYLLLDIEREWTSYTTLENGRYIDNIIRHELILAQDEILLDLTEQQKLALFQLVLENQNLKEKHQKRYGTIGKASSAAILSRIMYNDKYQPLLEEYENSSKMRESVIYITRIYEDTIKKIMTLSEEYLEILKNKTNDN
uniref:hypothetical protein n=1 Tax=uncultured Draconibacterium sp. TaxID=1573823 RepID=UPI0032166BA2